MRYTINKIVTAFALVYGLFATEAIAQSKPDTTVISKAQKINVLFGKQEMNRFVGNTNAVNGSELTTYPAMSIFESLAGKLPGVFILQNNGNLDESNFDTYVRGNLGG